MTHNSHSRMAICEAIADDAVKEIVSRMQEHFGEIPGLIGHSILVEEAGRMIILITEWRNRQDCLTYHAGRVCRQLVAATQHLLVGEYVVKLFQKRGGEVAGHCQEFVLKTAAPIDLDICSLGDDR